MKNTCAQAGEQERTIAALREQVEKLKAELKSIDGALNDPRANLTLTTSEIIWELKEQVEKLTEAYGQCGRTVQDYGRTITKKESRLREVATHCANVEQQLANSPTPLSTEDRKDAELLDYIQNHGATIQIVPMANRTFGFEVGGLHKSRKLSVREAIDAAMQEGKP